MAYAQTSYNDIQGINGRYTIHDIGCFLTGFCNLLGLRYGVDVSPRTLNQYFVARGTWIDIDDGIRDDLAWGSIAAYKGDVIVVKLGTGRPATNQAIVKFAYVSSRTGRPTTHFSLYDGDGFIIDSWDGVRRHITQTNYGEPVAYAEYRIATPQPVTPPAPTNQGVEMISTPDEAVKAYKMLRPNGQPSQDEINGTAGKRSYAQFINDAQNEINARDASIRDTATRAADLQAQLDGANTRLSQLTDQLVQAERNQGELARQLQEATAVTAKEAEKAAPKKQRPSFAALFIAALLKKKK